MKTDYKLESVSPLMFRIVGVTLTISGVLLLVTFPYRILGGITLMLIGLTMVFARRGVILDFENNKIKEYVGLFFIKIGRWNSLTEFPYVSVLIKNLKNTGFSRTGVEFSERTKVYRICLLNKSHRQRIRIKDFNKMESAISNAKTIAEDMGMELVDYNPK